jgi:hypothetical protein
MITVETSQTHAKLGWPGMRWDTQGGGGGKDRVIGASGDPVIGKPKTLPLIYTDDTDQEWGGDAENSQRSESKNLTTE